MHLQPLKLVRATAWEEMHLQENTFFDLDLGIKVTRNIFWFRLYHVIYAPARSEVATTNSLREDAITRNMTSREGQTYVQMDERMTDRLWY